MNAKNFMDLYGSKRVTEVAKAAGTNYNYFWHLANGKRRPSVELAKRLAKASGGEIDVMSLLMAVDWDEKRKAEQA